jgi:hypothetical protein
MSYLRWYSEANIRGVFRLITRSNFLGACEMAGAEFATPRMVIRKCPESILIPALVFRDSCLGDFLFTAFLPKLKI